MANNKLGNLIHSFNFDNNDDVSSTNLSINSLNDVDTNTNAPGTNQGLRWDGTNWVPADTVNLADRTEFERTQLIYPTVTLNEEGSWEYSDGLQSTRRLPLGKMADVNPSSTITEVSGVNQIFNFSTTAAEHAAEFSDTFSFTNAFSDKKTILVPDSVVIEHPTTFDATATDTSAPRSGNYRLAHNEYVFWTYGKEVGADNWHFYAWKLASFEDPENRFHIDVFGGIHYTGTQAWPGDAFDEETIKQLLHGHLNTIGWTGTYLELSETNYVSSFRIVQRELNIADNDILLWDADNNEWITGSIQGEVDRFITQRIDGTKPLNSSSWVTGVDLSTAAPADVDGTKKATIRLDITTGDLTRGSNSYSTVLDMSSTGSGLFMIMYDDGTLGLSVDGNPGGWFSAEAYLEPRTRYQIILNIDHRGAGTPSTVTWYVATGSLPSSAPTLGPTYRGSTYTYTSAAWYNGTDAIAIGENSGTVNLNDDLANILDAIEFNGTIHDVIYYEDVLASEDMSAIWTAPAPATAPTNATELVRKETLDQLRLTELSDVNADYNDLANHDTLAWDTDNQQWVAVPGGTAIFDDDTQWNLLRSYSENEVVHYDNSMWIATTAITGDADNNPPNADSARWSHYGLVGAVTMDNGTAITQTVIENIAETAATTAASNAVDNLSISLDDITDVEPNRTNIVSTTIGNWAVTGGTTYTGVGTDVYDNRPAVIRQRFTTPAGTPEGIIFERGQATGYTLWFDSGTLYALAGGGASSSASGQLSTFTYSFAANTTYEVVTDIETSGGDGVGGTYDMISRLTDANGTVLETINGSFIATTGAKPEENGGWHAGGQWGVGQAGGNTKAGVAEGYSDASFNGTVNSVIQYDNTRLANVATLTNTTSTETPSDGDMLMWENGAWRPVITYLRVADGATTATLQQLATDLHIGGIVSSGNSAWVKISATTYLQIT